MAILEEKAKIDIDIQNRKNMIAELEKEIDSNLNIKMRELNAKLNKLDVLKEELNNLRKESRRLLNEASGCKIEADARNITVTCCVKGY